jgi:hypothetical protein
MYREDNLVVSEDVSVDMFSDLGWEAEEWRLSLVSKVAVGMVSSLQRGSRAWTYIDSMVNGTVLL